jgi:protein-S-isoprenylcysteine O-methyltransferase Ste14
MSEQEYNKTLGLLRRLAIGALVAFLLWFAQPIPVLFGIGLVLVAAGESVRFWSAGHLLKTAELVTSGPYRYTRNPLYLGRLLIFSGLCLMANLPYYGSWIALVLGWGLFFGYYLPRKERVEPARLAKVHGEPFERYFKAVPALFPTFRPYADAGNSRWSRARMARNKEYWMVIGLLAASLFLLWRMNVLGGGI